MAAKFKFYEVVEVVSTDLAFSEISGLEGVVLGMAEDESGDWYYSVLMDQVDETWNVPSSALKETGKHKSRDEIYGGDTVLVAVNETGEGKIVD